MSYATIKRRTEQAAAPAENVSGCHASNCPRRGTISLGGDKFFCDAHAFSEADRWPRITESLRDHDWLIAFHDDLQRMVRACDPKQEWRSYAVQFWHDQEDGELLKPDPKEEAVPYMNRMRGELTYRCGLNKRPAIRLPQEIKGRGNMGSLLGRKAA